MLLSYIPACISLLKGTHLGFASYFLLKVYFPLHDILSLSLLPSYHFLWILFAVLLLTFMSDIEGCFLAFLSAIIYGPKALTFLSSLLGSIQGREEEKEEEESGELLHPVPQDPGPQCGPTRSRDPPHVRGRAFTWGFHPVTSAEEETAARTSLLPSVTFYWHHGVFGNINRLLLGIYLNF